MKNQNFNSKPSKMMDQENKQPQINQENNYYHSRETTTITDRPSMELDEKVNEKIGCQLCSHLK
jgi:hypothetical protein